MILHTVNKSPFDNSALNDCLKITTPNDAVLLIENGVYGAIDIQNNGASHCSAIKQLSQKGTRFYVLQADADARGVAEATLQPFFKMIDAEGFVALAAEGLVIQSWY